MKKYSIFSLLLSLFALNSAQATTGYVTTTETYPATVRYPTTETTACYATPTPVSKVVNYFTEPCEYRCFYDQGMYMSAIGGANWLYLHNTDLNNLKFNAGYLAGGAVGYKFGNGIRLEAEVTYRHNTMRHLEVSFAGVSEEVKARGSVHSMAYMLNGFYDFHTGSAFTPYVGVGIGYAKAHARAKQLGFELKDTSDGLAWQVMGGVDYAIDAKTSIGARYTYLDGNKEFRNHGASLVVTRTF